MQDSVRLLQKIGFGDYEARAYIGLLRGGAMTGYELAKATGLPRANVYDVLPKLEERGAVVRTDSPSGVRYSAVPTSQLMPRLADRFNDDIAAAEEALVDEGQAVENDYAWNIDGYRAVVDHARTLLHSAENEAVIALWPQEASALSQDMSRVEERGVPLTTLCLAGCQQECGNCRGDIHRYRISPDESSRWLVVEVDNREILAGEITGEESAGRGVKDGDDGSAYAIRSSHRMLVELGGWYVRNSIALAAIVSDMGDRLADMISPQAARVLSSLRRGGLAAGWLEQIRMALGRPPVSPAANTATRNTEPRGDAGREGAIEHSHL